MDEKWTPMQYRALEAVAAWLREPDAPQVFRLEGYAGTGKTTLARWAAQQSPNGRTYYCAYTGKAASVMRSKGCDGASTIHQLIYLPAHRSRDLLQQLEQRTEEVRKELGDAVDESEACRNLRRQLASLLESLERERKHLAQPHFTLNPLSPLAQAGLVVVDECSMVDERVGRDLQSFGKKILVLGDPAQLPPVKGTGYFMQGEPDFLLTEVHRQAAESPILRMATDVRQGRPLNLGGYGEECWVVHRNATKPDDVRGVDQVLCGTNATRKVSNSRARQLLGKGVDWRPVPGDRLVCLRNDHDEGLLNGTLWDVQEAEEVNDEEHDLKVREVGGEQVVQCRAWSRILRGEGFAEGTPYWERADAQEFDYGYCLTVHKAQGSQWDSVMVLDESWYFRQDARRWLYTAITRAARQLMVVDRRSSIIHNDFE